MGYIKFIKCDIVKLDEILNGISGRFVKKDDVNYLRIGNSYCIPPFPINANYSCMVVHEQESNCFAFSIAKEVKEFVKDPEIQICELIKQFMKEYEWCNEIFKDDCHLRGIRVITNPDISEKQKEDFSNETKFKKNFKCREINEKEFRIESWAFEDEDKFEVSAGLTIDRDGPIDKVASLLNVRAWASFSSYIHSELNMKIRNLDASVYNKSINVKKFYYGEEGYGAIHRYILHFSEIGGIKSIHEPELEDVRKSFESKIAIETQKSLEDSTKATVEIQKSVEDSTRKTARLTDLLMLFTGILAVFTGVLALTAIAEALRFTLDSSKLFVVRGGITILLLIVALYLYHVRKWKKS